MPAQVSEGLMKPAPKTKQRPAKKIEKRKKLDDTEVHGGKYF